MANLEHLKILEQGAEVWNKWREKNIKIKPDLSQIDLSSRIYFGVNFSNTNFSNSLLKATRFYSCNLSGSRFKNIILDHVVMDTCTLKNSVFKEIIFLSSNLSNSEFVNCKFSDIRFSGTQLIRSDFSKSLIQNAIFYRTDFSYTNLSYVIFRNLNVDLSLFWGANLSNASFIKAQIFASNLESSIFIKTHLEKTILNNSRIYGISAWDIHKKNLSQENLIITPTGESEITIDDLEIAQFIYLLLNNQNIRNVINTITSKAVLILGRFTEERKKVLDALKDELRQHNYLPIIFDFDKPSRRDIDETINLLARMSCFIIADVTDAKSIPQELKGFIESNSIPLVPLILKGQSEYAMFDHFRKYQWVLPLFEYESIEILLANIIPVIIIPAEQKIKELLRQIT